MKIEMARIDVLRLRALVKKEIDKIYKASKNVPTSSDKFLNTINEYCTLSALHKVLDDQLLSNTREVDQ